MSGECDECGNHCLECICHESKSKDCMNKEQDKALDKVLEALSFYANANIYWGKPMDIGEDYDQRTLRACHASKEASQIMQDRGELARKALYEFEGVFDCVYQFQTEI